MDNQIIYKSVQMNSISTKIKSLFIKETDTYCIDIVGIGFNSCDLKNINNLILKVMIGSNIIINIKFSDLIIFGLNVHTDKISHWTYINFPNDLFFDNENILYCNPYHKIYCEIISDTDIYFNIYLHLKFQTATIQFDDMSQISFKYKQITKPINIITNCFEFKCSETLDGFLIISNKQPIINITIQIDNLIYNLDQNILLNYKYYDPDKKILYFKFTNYHILIPKTNSQIILAINKYVLNISNFIIFPIYDNYLIYSNDLTNIHNQYLIH